MALSLLDRRVAAELKKAGALTEETTCKISLRSAALGTIDDTISEIIAIDVYCSPIVRLKNTTKCT